MFSDSSLVTTAGPFVLAYLMGGVLFARLAMIGTGVDIRKVGSGNPGFNNVLRVSTVPRALFTLAGDIGKAYLALWLLTSPGDSDVRVWSLALMPVLGHCWSPFEGFRGGKGVSSTTGVALFIEPMLALLCAPVYVIVRAICAKLRVPQKGAIASLAGILVFAVALWIVRGYPAVFATILFAIVTARHHTNLRQMLKTSSAAKAETVRK